MSLFGEVVETFVQDNVPSPPPVEFLAVLVYDFAQRHVPLRGTNRHDFSQLTIKVNTHCHIRVHEQAVIGLEMVGE